MESNDSPEIPDRGETSDIPGLPSGERRRKNSTRRWRGRRIAALERGRGGGRGGGGKQRRIAAGCGGEGGREKMEERLRAE